jgi:hypothetical protein
MPSVFPRCDDLLREFAGGFFDPILGLNIFSSVRAVRAAPKFNGYAMGMG